jgi:hypothetical protein
MIKKFTRSIVLILSIQTTICFFSCKKRITKQSDLIAYINDPDNGLQKTQQIGQIKAVLTYKPGLITAFKQQPSIKTDKTNPLNFKDKLFFVLSLSTNNKEVLRQLPFSQYSEMVQVLAFRMNEFIEAIPDDGKPVEPIECLFQQTYGMGIANNVLIVFNKEKLLDANNLKIKVKEFGLNTGNLNFEIETKYIRNLQNNIALN